MNLHFEISRIDCNLFFCTSRKRSAKSAKDDKHADPEEVDPGTLIAADDGEGGVAGLLQDNNNAATKTKGKKGKKKGKKKKMTKSEKDLVCSWHLCWLCECLLFSFANCNANCMFRFCRN